MVYLLALASALFYGAADFMGGLTSRRAGAIPVVVISQFSGMLLLALLLPVLPAASPSREDLLWGAAAGLTGGVGVALLYRALTQDHGNQHRNGDHRRVRCRHSGAGCRGLG